MNSRLEKTNLIDPLYVQDEKNDYLIYQWPCEPKLSVRLSGGRNRTQTCDPIDVLAILVCLHRQIGESSSIWPAPRLPILPRAVFLSIIIYHIPPTQCNTIKSRPRSDLSGVCAGKVSGSIPLISTNGKHRTFVRCFFVGENKVCEPLTSKLEAFFERNGKSCEARREAAGFAAASIFLGWQLRPEMPQ